MEFRNADTFVDSLPKLGNQEQKLVKTTVFDLQVNLSSPGLSFHKLDRAQDPNFASLRVSSDIRLIRHLAPRKLLICFVAHHEAAYRWAAQRKLETHPTTGAAQLGARFNRTEEVASSNLAKSTGNPPSAEGSEF
jgi:mRNA-degrading endonuclease RelE of RelBE toxin-antitoxin system